MAEPTAVPEGVEAGFGDEVEQAMAMLHRRNRRGFAVIDYELLGALIGLPEGSQITGLFADPLRRGMIVTMVSDDLPEIDDAASATQVDWKGAVRLMPAAPATEDEPLVFADPDSDDVMYARIEFKIPPEKRIS